MMQKNYTRPQKNKPNFAPIYLISFVLFLILIIIGAYQALKEIRSISQGQQILILSLTDSGAKKRVDKTDTIGNEEISSDEVVSKVEFIKQRNEIRKVIKDLNYQIRLIQTKLRMKKMPLLRE